MTHITQYSNIFQLLLDTYNMSTPPDDLFSLLGALLFFCAVAAGLMSFLRYQASGKGIYLAFLSLGALFAVPFIGAAPSWLNYLHRPDLSSTCARLSVVLSIFFALVAAAQLLLIRREPEQLQVSPDASAPNVGRPMHWMTIFALLFLDTWAINLAIFGSLILLSELSEPNHVRIVVLIACSMVVVGLIRSAYLVLGWSKDLPHPA